MGADHRQRARRRSAGTSAAQVAAITGGSEQHWARLYAQYGSAVLAFASHYLCNRALAEDVLQEVFVRLWSRAEPIDVADGSLRSSLLTETRLRCEEIMSAEEMGCSEPHQKGSALVRLPLEERLPISLAHFGELSYQEAAEVLDWPEARVASRLRRGLQRMGCGDVGRV